MTNINELRGSGTQLLEFALLLSLLFLMGMFVTEAAGFPRMHPVLNNAAREGARLSVLDSLKCADPTCSTDLRITNEYYLCSNGISNQTCGGPRVAVTINQQMGVLDGNGRTISTSVVTVSRHALPLMSSAPGFGVPSAIMLAASAQFRDFYNW